MVCLWNTLHLTIKNSFLPHLTVFGFFRSKYHPYYDTPTDFIFALHLCRLWSLYDNKKKKSCGFSTTRSEQAQEKEKGKQFHVTVKCPAVTQAIPVTWKQQNSRRSLQSTRWIRSLQGQARISFKVHSTAASKHEVVECSFPLTGACVAATRSLWVLRSTRGCQFNCTQSNQNI